LHDFVTTAIVQDEQWHEAMFQEIHTLEISDMWKLTNLPLGNKTLGCKCIYKSKYNSNGTIARFKAGLVISRIIK